VTVSSCQNLPPCLRIVSISKSKRARTSSSPEKGRSFVGGGGGEGSGGLQAAEAKVSPAVADALVTMMNGEAGENAARRWRGKET